MSRGRIAAIVVGCTVLAAVMIVMIVVVARIPTYALSVSVSPSGAGSVSASSGEYKSGTEVELEASPASGYTFNYWSGGAFGTSPTAVITVNRDTEVTAHFARIHALTTDVSPEGAGSVSPSAGQYKAGSQVILTATAASGYMLDYWGAVLSDTSPTKTIIMDSDKEVTAHFAKVYTLTTSIDPSGAGSVSPFGGEFKSGTKITLEARPASGYAFYYWRGDALGNASTITITMDSDKDVTAHFYSRDEPPVPVVPVVEYKITGSASRVFVTIGNATGGIEQFDNVRIPHSYKFERFDYWFLYVSAQNMGASGSVTVTIYLHGRAVATSTSSGAYVIATASYSRL